MDFKSRVREYISLTEAEQISQQTEKSQQIILILKYLVDNNPNASNEDILKLAEEKLGPVQGNNKEQVIKTIEQLKQQKKLPINALKSGGKKPGFFKRVVLRIIAPVLGIVGGVAGIASFFTPEGSELKNTLRMVTGFTMPTSMAIGVGAQISNARSQGHV